ncbi:hypothetical protein ACIPSD_04620 [Pectobacterium sp. CHL-2024]
MTEKNTGTKHKDENDHPAKDQGEIPRKRDDSKDDVDDPFDANKA